MQNSIAMFSFSVFDQKYPFWANLVQKNQNRHSKLRLRTKTNSIMQYSIDDVCFFRFRPESLFG